MKYGDSFDYYDKDTEVSQEGEYISDLVSNEDQKLHVGLYRELLLQEFINM